MSEEEKAKKRAAICFSGQLRNLESGYNFIKPNIIDANKEDWDIDVFIHTWFEKKLFGYTYPLWCGGNASSSIPFDILDKVYDYYDPTKIMIEKQIDFHPPAKFETRKSSGITIKNSISKCYSIQKSIELKQKYEEENQFVYDLVQTVRTDLGFKSKINYNDFDLNYYNTSPWGVHNGIGVDVTQSIMNSQNADIYGSILEKIEYYWDSGTKFCDEHLFHRHLEEHNIPINRTDLLANVEILRS